MYMRGGLSGRRRSILAVVAVHDLPGGPARPARAPPHLYHSKNNTTTTNNNNKDINIVNNT